MTKKRETIEEGIVQEEKLIDIQSFMDIVGVERMSRTYYTLKYRKENPLKTIKDWEKETGLSFNS